MRLTKEKGSLQTSGKEALLNNWKLAVLLQIQYKNSMLVLLTERQCIF